MRRREFIAGLAGAATLPMAVRAQQAESVRRIGVLLAFDENNPVKGWLSGFTGGLSEAGWTVGRNVQIDLRWAAGSIERIRTYAKELVDLRPDVILAHTTPVTAALHRETQTIPIVFVFVADPIGSSFVTGLPHPGGNVTGFIDEEAGLAGKWLELLTQIAPNVRRVAMMINPDTAPSGGAYFLPPFEIGARSLNLEPVSGSVRSEAEIENFMISFGREPRGGLIVMPDLFMQVHRRLIISLAARTNLPAVYQLSLFAREGGLISYGPDGADLFRRAAPYVDRILRGAKPADLPVQLPIKFELAINLKTASALSLVAPPTILVRADQVIE